MSDSEASGNAEIDRMKAAADRVAKRTSQSFVIDPAKLARFTPLQVDTGAPEAVEGTRVKAMG